MNKDNTSANYERDQAMRKWSEDTIRKIARDNGIVIEPNDIDAIAHALSDALKEATTRQLL